MDSHNHAGEAMRLAADGRPLRISLFIITGIMIAEVIGGLVSNSLALLGDAGHMLVDALALGLSLFAMTLARRPATLRRTYGYHRAEILAALANGITIGLVAFYIFYEAYRRFLTPPEVRPPLMLAVATLGLFGNLAVLLLLRQGSHGSLNIKAAFWHVIGDTISSVGVIIAGIVILLTGWTLADPIIAVIIGGIILWGAVGLVRESIDILAEAVPKGIKLDEVIGAMKTIPGVEDVHDIHVWAITSGMYALSAHLLIVDQMVSRGAEILQAAQQALERNFNITHTTLQLECERCDLCPDGFMCDIRRPGSGEHANHPH